MIWSGCSPGCHDREPESTHSGRASHTIETPITSTELNSGLEPLAFPAGCRYVRVI